MVEQEIIELKDKAALNSTCAKCQTCVEILEQPHNKIRNLTAYNLKRHLGMPHQAMKSNIIPDVLAPIITQSEPKIENKIRRVTKMSAVEVKRGGRSEYICAGCGKLIAKGEAHMRQNSKGGFKRYHKACWDEAVTKVTKTPEV